MAALAWTFLGRAGGGLAVPTRLRGCFIAIVSLLLAHSHDARGLTLLADDRYVHDYSRTEPFPPDEVTATPATPFGPFHYAGIGAQDSEMSLVAIPGGGDSLSGNASGSAVGLLFSSDSVSSTSEFSIRFRVDGASAAIDLSGLLNGSSTFFSSFVELSSGSTVLYEESVHYDDFLNPVPTPFAFSTLIGPGEYQLRALSSVSVGIPGNRSDGSFSLGFAVAENVPEPSTVLLVALGAAGLAGARRRSMSRGSPRSRRQGV
jgi:hypothetical protein